MNNNLIELDKLQRQQALNADESFIVQAPAGSGKTELLIQRFLTLLNHVKTPEEILAITFTKKAANEMRARILNALKFASTEPEPESPHAKQTWFLARKVLEKDEKLNWNLIDNPNQLRIQTIDSLCSYLTKQLPMLSHFGSQPGIADYPKWIYQEAVQEVLTHVEADYDWSPAISELLLHLDNDLNKLHDLLVGLLEKRDQWLPYIQLNTGEAAIKVKLEHHLSLVIRDHLTTLTEVFPKNLIPEVMSILQFATSQLTLTHPDSEIVACKDLKGLPLKDAKHKKEWMGIARLLLTKSFTWRKRVDAEIGFPALASLKNAQEKAIHQDYRQRLTTIITQLNDHEDLRLALAELFFLPEDKFDKTQWNILKALLEVLKIVAAQLRLTFQNHGHIDFIENSQAALAALGNDENPTDLALALDYQIRHILVDEFQDTAFTQYQLLEKLITGWEPNDGRTLFVVGDPMQSIYRFREAEVGLFMRMRKTGIGHVKLTPLTLSVNFRSAAKVVEWNNQHFQKIFPSFNDMATGAVTYSPSASLKELEHNDPSVEINVKGFVDTDEVAQANYIIQVLTQIQQQYPQEKIAILVRSRTHLKAIIPALKKAQIPFKAVDIDPLASRQSIQDLLSLTCAMLHPADRIAWLSVLRAPWCGLSLSDLLLISGSNAYQTIWEQITNPLIQQKLSPEGQIKIARLISLLTLKLAERERYDLRYWIESTWLSLGGPACLHDISDIDDANAFFKLLDKFSLNHQTIHLGKLKENINQLYASTNQDEANLQIMTIHTAKGLEFDTVILPHLERKMPSDDKSLLLWMERPLLDDQTALLLAPIHAIGNEDDKIYEYIHRQQRVKSNYETNRLFYVATTRAKKRLHLFFNIDQKDNGDFRVESGSFLEKIWPLFEKHQQEILVKNTENITSDTPNLSKQRFIYRLTSDWMNPLHQVPGKEVSAHQQQTGFKLAESKSQLIGTITHRILQLLSLHGKDWWQAKSALAQFDYISRQLKQQGMLMADLEEGAQLAQQAITQTLNDKRGQWILEKHQEAQSEFALSACIDGKIENLVIDRTFIDEAGVRWIIDYKTSTLSHHDVEKFLAKEQKKYVEQMRKYHQAMKLTENRPIRLGLYFPAVPAWKEWEF